MTEDTQENIFTRGFSTKQKEDRGIGMFLVKSIVERVEGHIDIQSKKNEGTIMSIFLPMKRKGEEKFDSRKE